jgi:hypothetical protein
LITGTGSKSAIGTLAGRMTGFTMLLHLPAGHGALQVQDAMADVMSGLPQILRQTLTWDQGSEMASHVAIARRHRPGHLLRRPSLPWQRGSNENTNELLHQYFPKAPTCLATTTAASAPLGYSDSAKPRAMGSCLPRLRGSDAVRVVRRWRGALRGVTATAMVATAAASRQPIGQAAASAVRP